MTLRKKQLLRMMLIQRIMQMTKDDIAENAFHENDDDEEDNADDKG